MGNERIKHSFYKDAFSGRNGPLIWLLGLVVIFLLYSNTSMPWFEPLWNGLKYVLDPGPAIPVMERMEKIVQTNPFGYYLFPIFLGFFALLFAQLFLRRRPLRKLINGLPAIRWRRLFFAFAVFWIIASLYWVFSFIVKYLTHQPDVLEQLGVGSEKISSDYFKNRQPLIFIITSTLTVPFSVLVYEMIYRGYLDQAVRRFISSRWAAIVIGASLYAFIITTATLLFPGLMIQSDAGGVILQTFLSSMVFGFFLSLLCDHDQGIEAGIGLSIADSFFLSFAYPVIMPWVVKDDFLDNFELPMAAYFQYYLFIPVVILLLYWSYGAQRDKFS